MQQDGKRTTPSHWLPFLHTHCRDTPTLTEAEVAEGLKALPAWQLSEDRRYISRQFVARNFTAGEGPRGWKRE